MSIPSRVTAVACQRSRTFCHKCRWQVRVKHTCIPTKSVWADYVVQAWRGNLSRKRAHLQLVRKRSSTIVSARQTTVDWSRIRIPHWCAWTNVHLLKERKKKSAGGKWFVEGPQKAWHCEEKATTTTTTSWTRLTTSCPRKDTDGDRNPRGWDECLLFPNFSAKWSFISTPSVPNREREWGSLYLRPHCHHRHGKCPWVNNCMDFLWWLGAAPITNQSCCSWTSNNSHLPLAVQPLQLLSFFSALYLTKTLLPKLLSKTLLGFHSTVVLRWSYVVDGTLKSKNELISIDRNRSRFDFFLSLQICFSRPTVRTSSSGFEVQDKWVPLC